MKRKMVGVFAVVAIGSKDFVSSGVAVEIGVVADFVQNFVFFKGVAGFRIVEFGVSATSFVGLALRCCGNSIDAVDSSASVIGIPTAVVISSFAILLMTPKPCVIFGDGGFLEFFGERIVERSR